MKAWEVFWQFAVISVLAYGGGSGIPLIERTAVREQGWIGQDEFAASISLAQVTPGPVMVVATFIGQRAAGAGGAIAATAGVFLIPCILAGALSSRLAAARPPRWTGGPGRELRQQDRAPGETVITLARHSLYNWRYSAIAILTLIVTAFTRIHPLWVLSGGAFLGIMAATTGSRSWQGGFTRRSIFTASGCGSTG